MPMKIVVTIHEPTPERAIEAIRAIPARHDLVEVRLDAFQTPAGPFQTHIAQEMLVDASEFPLEFRLCCEFPRESPPCGGCRSRD